MATKHTGLFLLILLGAPRCSGWKIMIWMKNPHRLSLSKLILIGACHFSQKTTDDNIYKLILTLEVSGTFMGRDLNIIQKKIKDLAIEI
ncbi:MAG: hypothetical protein ACMUEK_03275 [Sodalis sp. (in: enterobacteria)]